jgi:DNA-binding response OmpR family regulator
MRQLRAKLAPGEDAPQLIATESGVGYRLLILPPA